MLSPSFALTGYTNDGAMARRRIDAALRGPVIDLLATLLPEVARLPRHQAFDIVIGDCDLLYRCFQAFRAHRRHFAVVLLDHRNRPVDGDNQLLACGRTLNQVVAMIVRSAAKRYFRRHLDPRPAPPESPPAGGWVGWLDRLFGLAPPPQKSAADRLYDAIKATLLHDWQVPIIPQYARMTPPAVTRLGARILDFHTAAELAAYLDDGVEPPPAEPALAEPPRAEPVAGATRPAAPPERDERARLGEILTDDGSRLRLKAVVPVLMRPEVLALTGVADRDALGDLRARLHGTGGATVRQLAIDFGMSPAQMVVFLAAAIRNLPAPVYDRLFGPGADRRLIQRIILRARAAGLTQSSPLAAFDAFADALFRPFRP